MSSQRIALAIKIGPLALTTGPLYFTALYVCMDLIWLPQSGPIYVLTADLNPRAEMSANVD